MRTVFTQGEDGQWLPAPEARGPFAGLQGGAVAGLLTAEIEQITRAKELGAVVGIAASFYKPAPMGPLRTRPTALRVGRRVSFYGNTLLGLDGEACASVRATLIREAPIELPQPRPLRTQPLVDPSAFRLRSAKAPHGEPWFMDIMEARVADDGTAWFRVRADIIEGAGPIARAVGPADWCHGIHRPFRMAVADPNPDLGIRFARPPQGDWIGVRATTLWEATGLGIGFGTLLDVFGEFGAVSMSVALMPIARDARSAAFVPNAVATGAAFPIAEMTLTPHTEPMNATQASRRSNA